MTTDNLSRRQSKYTPRKAPEGERLATSAMIASLDAEGRDTVAAPFGREHDGWNIKRLIIIAEVVYRVYRFSGAVSFNGVVERELIDDLVST